MTFPFLICRTTAYKLDEITPEVLLAASESFRRFPPELHLSDEVKEERNG